MEPQCLVSRGRPKNIVLFEREDVTVMENGVVLTKSLSEIEQIKRKPGRFKTKINFRRDMTSGEVRRTLEENFPTLQNRRYDTIKTIFVCVGVLSCFNFSIGKNVSKRYISFYKLQVDTIKKGNCSIR